MGDLTAGSTITVTDSSTPPVQASQTFGLIINPTPAVTASPVPTVVPIAAVQNAFSVTSLQAVGGAPPYTWSVTSGLPAGMVLSSSGVLSGTPTGTGVFLLMVGVTDSAGRSTGGSHLYGYHQRSDNHGEHSPGLFREWRR